MSKLSRIARRAVDEFDAHLAQSEVDARVVNNLVGQKDAPVGKLSPRFICQVQSEVHAITDPELFRKPKRKTADLERVALLLDFLHHTAMVVSDEGIADLSLEAKPPPDNGIRSFFCRNHVSATRQRRALLSVESNNRPVTMQGMQAITSTTGLHL